MKTNAEINNSWPKTEYERREGYRVEAKTFLSKARDYESIMDYYRAAEMYYKAARELSMIRDSYNSIEEYDEEIEDIESSLAFYTEHPTQINLEPTGYIDNIKDKQNKAKECRQELVAIYEQIAAAYIGEGESALKIDDGRQYEDVAVEAYLSAASAILRSGKYNQAISVCDQVIELDPENFYAHYYKFHSLFDTGQIKKAAESYVKARDLDTDNHYISSNEVILLYAHLAENIHWSETNLIHEVMSYLTEGYDLGTEKTIIGEDATVTDKVIVHT